MIARDQGDISMPVMLSASSSPWNSFVAPTLTDQLKKPQSTFRSASSLQSFKMCIWVSHRCSCCGQRTTPKIDLESRWNCPRWRAQQDRWMSSGPIKYPLPSLCGNSPGNTVDAPYYCSACRRMNERKAWEREERKRKETLAHRRNK